MIKSSVTIALVPQIKTGPWIYWGPLEICVSKAAALGFDGVELFTATADSVDVVKLKTLLDSTGVKLSAVGTGAGKVIKGLSLTDPDESIRRHAISFITDMISFGAVFDAPAIIGSIQGKAEQGTAKEQAISWLIEGLNILGEFAEIKKVKLLFEPLNRYETNLVNTIEEAAALCDKLNNNNVSLLADLFHMNIEESFIPDTIQSFGKYIGHVHFADSNRKPIGNGHTEMNSIAEALFKVGFAGYVSAEAFPWPDPDQAAEKTIESFRQYFPQKMRK